MKWIVFFLNKIYYFMWLAFVFEASNIMSSKTNANWMAEKKTDLLQKKKNYKNGWEND